MENIWVLITRPNESTLPLTWSKQPLLNNLPSNTIDFLPHFPLRDNRENYTRFRITILKYPNTKIQSKSNGVKDRKARTNTYQYSSMPCRRLKATLSTKRMIVACFKNSASFSFKGSPLVQMGSVVRVPVQAMS